MLALIPILAALAPPLSGQGVPSRPPSFYQRLTERLVRDSALARRLDARPGELDSLNWLLGSWEVEVRVFATPTTPERTSRGSGEVALVLGGRWVSFADSYGTGTRDLGFLTIDAVTGQWRSVQLLPTGESVVTAADAWHDGRLVFTSPGVEIAGIPVTLRQTLERLGPQEYRIVNQEQLPDGSWVGLDEYHYRRPQDVPASGR